MLVFILESFVFGLLSENLKIKIYKAIVLHTVLHGCKSTLHTVRGRHRDKVLKVRSEDV
jgi:hypothetical protein